MAKKKNAVKLHKKVFYIEPIKVNKVTIFSETFYMVKGVLTFVSGVQKSVLVYFISQNKSKVYIQSNFVRIVFMKSFLAKTNKSIFFKKLF